MSAELALERQFSRCPELNKDIIEREFPPVGERNFLIMRDESELRWAETVVCPWVSKDTKGEPFVDLYIWDPVRRREGAENPVRFVLSPGYALSFDEEERLFEYCHKDILLMPSAWGKKFCADFAETFPQLHFPGEDTGDIFADRGMRRRISGEFLEYGRMIEQVYFSMHRSGAREILYKAGLDNIAFMLDRVDEYNIIGASPEEILGLPLQLLRILNQKGFLKIIFDAGQRRKAERVYRSYANYLGKMLPTCYQWRYLERIYEENEPFKRSHYRVYARAADAGDYDGYRYYLHYKDALGPMNPYRKTPKPEDLWRVVTVMSRIGRLLNDEERFNKDIERHSGDVQLDYEDEKYRVVVPKTVRELIHEATGQKNCILESVPQIARGETHIVFLRKKAAPDKTYISIEVRNGKIVQAYGACNRVLRSEERKLVRKYAAAKKLQALDSSEEIEEWMLPPEEEDEPEEWLE